MSETPAIDLAGIDRYPELVCLTLTGKQGMACLEGLLLYAGKHTLNDTNYAAARSAFTAIIKAMRAMREIETEAAE
jgi:hypothetical protein